MAKSILDEIQDKDLEKLGLRILIHGEKGINGRYEQDGETEYIQITDENGILDDGTFRCHFELLRIYKTVNNERHEKGKIYVEVHFEEPVSNKYFRNIVTGLLQENKDLESFPWVKNCPSIRLKDNGFELSQGKEEILSNLQKLRSITLNTILKYYGENDLGEEKNLVPGFEYNQSNGKKTANKRDIKNSTRTARTIDVFHEEIKSQLITSIKDNPCILSKDCEIDCNTIVTEHPVNKINFIDLVAKTKDEKIVFFEIKTAASARLCIRQALGQLMEYAYFPSTKHADILVVVGTGKKDKNIKDYLQKLNSQFKINVDYLCI